MIGYLLTILESIIIYDATRAIKVKTELLGRKYGYKIPIIGISAGGI